MIRSFLNALPVVKDSVIHTTTAGFAVMATTFLQNSLRHMIPWLMVMFIVIVCDLVTGLRKSMAQGVKVTISGAIRRTLGKAVTYFSFVAMVAMICVASGEQYGIDKWACLLVCGIEGISIVGNILKTKGYDLNVLGLVSAILLKMFGGEKKDYEDIITEKEEKAS